MEKGTSLYEPGALITHVLFPVGGMVSLGYAAASGETVELALVGREGVVGIEAFLGAERSSHRATAQTMCAAYRLPVSVARSLFAEHGELQRATLKYALSVMLQVSHTSFCNLHHSPEQRLCRSLLQSVDRNASDTLPMTQDALASLVGARRQGVSEAVKRLRDRGAIAYGRGTITVLDRGRLLRSACDCYAAVQAQLEALRVDNLR